MNHLPADAAQNLIVVSSKPSDEVADGLAEAGVNLNTVAHVPISGSEMTYDGQMYTCEALVPDDLTGLSMRLSRAFEALESDGYLLVENLNVFLMYASESRVVRFVNHMTGMAGGHDITGIYTLLGDTVSEETYEQFRLSVDTEVDGL